MSEAIQTLRERGVVTGQVGTSWLPFMINPPFIHLLQTSLELELLVSDLNDNYRLFTVWEAMLHQPIMFSEQLTFQVLDAVQWKIKIYTHMSVTVTVKLAMIVTMTE